MSLIVKVGKAGKRVVKKFLPEEKHHVSYTRRIERVKTRERVVAMTFDDGPMDLPSSPDKFDGKALTDILLDTLGEYGAQGTFDVVGDTSENYPDTRPGADRRSVEQNSRTSPAGRRAVPGAVRIHRRRKLRRTILRIQRISGRTGSAAVPVRAVAGRGSGAELRGRPSRCGDWRSRLRSSVCRRLCSDSRERFSGSCRRSRSQAPGLPKSR